MDWSTYKDLCHQPNILSRWLLLETQKLLSNTEEGSAIKLQLQQILEGQPLPRPLDHKGNSRVDMFMVVLPSVVVRQIWTTVKQAKTTDVNQASITPNLTGISAAWKELLEFQEQNK